MDEETARYLNEVLGVTAALTALIASMPGVDAETIKTAKGLVGSLTPGPVPNSPRGTAPGHFSDRTLDRVASIARDLDTVRKSGGT